MHALPLTSLAEQFGTPLYLYDAGQLQQNINAFQAHITYRPFSLYAPLMANNNPHLLEICRNCGMGAFVNSPYHLALALHRVGWSPAEIIYASSNTQEVVLQRIAQLGVGFHADSLRELELYGRQAHRRQVGLRLAWPMPDRSRPGRLGLRLTEIDQALQLARRHQLQITGLHLYLGTNISQAGYYLAQLRQLLPYAPSFPNLAYIDLSGGFAVSGEDGQFEFDYRTFDQGVTELLTAHAHQTGQNLELVLEPGRAVFATAGYFLTRVIDVKSYPDQIFVGVDGSVVQLPLAFFHQGRVHHPITVVNSTTPPLNRPVTICGASTYSRDYLARDVLLPTVAPGDLLVFGHAGAYGYAYRTDFLGLARPAEVLVTGNDARLVNPAQEVIL